MKNKVVILGWSDSIHIQRWTEGLKTLGYDITLISNGGQPLPNIETIIVGNNPKGAFSYFSNKKYVSDLIKKIAPDLIHSFLATGYGYWGTSKYNCPKILTPLGSEIIDLEAKNWMYRLILKRIVNHYQQYTTASKYLENELNRTFPQTKNKVDLIPFGTFISDDVKEHQDIKPIKLIYLKHLVKIYGPDTLLEAINILKNKKYPVLLDLYGDEKYSVWLKDMVRELQLEEYVTFKGWLKSESIPARLLDYDIMVMPSRIESFGVAAVEAGSAGLPVIASNIGGIPEIIEDEVTGILFPAGDAEKLAETIIHLSDNFTLRKEMGNAARKKVMAKFNWNDNLKTMGDLYDRMISDWRRK